MDSRIPAYVLLVLLAPLAGCMEDDGNETAGETPGDGDTPIPDDRPVAFENVERGHHSGRTATGVTHVVVESQDEWEEFWESHSSNNGTDPPAVDFDARFVLAVLMGTRPTGGHAIEVREVMETGRGYEVEYDAVSPGDGCPVTLALTNPYHIVSLPRAGDDVPDVHLDGDEETREC